MIPYSDEIEKILQAQNREYKRIVMSPEYSKGSTLIEMGKTIKKMDFAHFLDMLSGPWQQRKISRLGNKNKYEETVRTLDSRQKRIVVFTCVVGGYDELWEPIGNYNNITYVCFSDRKKNDGTLWHYREIPEKLLRQGYSNSEINRYIKMHPFELFDRQKYDYAIYVDGNVKIAAYIGDFILNCSEKTGLGIFAHNARNCVYQEAKVCIIRKKGNKKKIVEQVERYRIEGFPKAYGLYEATIIVFELKHPKLEQIMKAWWEELIRTKSQRDQLALPYLMWKNGYQYSDIGILGNNIFEDDRISVFCHKK